jgi:hypothetical protein
MDMAERIKTIDESLSYADLRKTITGQVDVELDTSRITISPSGNIQPATTNQQGHTNQQTGTDDDD